MGDEVRPEHRPDGRYRSGTVTISGLRMGLPEDMESNSMPDEELVTDD
jgi:hypothetical protein